jgi:hypothetical protein
LVVDDVGDAEVGLPDGLVVFGAGGGADVSFAVGCLGGVSSVCEVGIKWVLYLQPEFLGLFGVKDDVSVEVCKMVSYAAG